ncbi:MAG: TAXI family TRAP transporter solute-binding subunit [Rhodocyclaceae bacterium]|nr:MAG: TAXI family TRAP transporter solute-binding subunit [Rhodocyclaceae bacterium]
MNKLLRTLFLCITSMLAATAFGQSKTNLSIGTGGTGGVYYPLGGGMASILTKHVPGWQVTAEVTGASVDNMKLINSGKTDVGFTMADTAWEAYIGADKYKDRKVPIRTLIVLYPNRTHVVTVEGTGINSMQDLKGKRISVVSPGSGTEILSLRLLEAYGLTNDVKRERLSVAESVNAIKDRKIDAFIWSGGLPTAAVTDLAATPGTKIKLIDHSEAIDPLNKKYGPLYVKDVIPQATYAGMDKTANILTVWNILAVSEKMPDSVAYTIIKTLFDYKADLVATHKEATNMSVDIQTTAHSPIPFHPGAIKYFNEKGAKLK